MHASGVFKDSNINIGLSQKWVGKSVKWELKLGYVLWVSIINNALERDLR